MSEDRRIGELEAEVRKLKGVLSRVQRWRVPRGETRISACSLTQEQLSDDIEDALGLPRSGSGKWTRPRDA